jgi:hypothetical protein
MAILGRINIEKESNGITVRIKPKKNWFALLYIPFILAVWTFAGVLLINAVLKGQETGHAIILLWLGFWLMIEAIIIFAFLWNVWGEEIISIRDARFTRKLAVHGVGLKKSFPANEVFNLRTSGLLDGLDKEMNDRFWWPLGMAEETAAVSTKYLMEYKFGIRLEASEAAVLAKALEPYLPATSNNSFNPSGINSSFIRET